MRGRCTRRALFAGLAALPFVGTGAAAKEPEPIEATAGLVLVSGTGAGRARSYTWRGDLVALNGDVISIESWAFDGSIKAPSYFANDHDPYAYQNWLERESRKRDPETWRAIDDDLARMYAEEFGG